MTNGFYITIKKGLLDKKHRENMQVNQKTSAIWLFLWFLDKVTKVENDMGVVDGGKPFKIADCDLAGEQAIQKMFQQLQKHSYIITQRTPHGTVIYIPKAFKVFGLKVTKESATSEANKNPKKVLHHPKKVLHQGKESATSQQESATSNIRQIYKEIYKESLQEIVDYWNISYKTRYKPVEGLLTNLEYWLKTYSLEEIKIAVSNIRHHEFWSGKMTPTMLFRQKSPKQEPVDYIGDLLSTKVPKSYMPDLTAEQMQQIYAERMKARESN